MWLIHYSQGISHVRILATELSWHIETEEEPDYDREVQMGPALCALAEGIGAPSGHQWRDTGVLLGCSL